MKKDEKQMRIHATRLALRARLRYDKEERNCKISGCNSAHLATTVRRIRGHGCEQQHQPGSPGGCTTHNRIGNRNHHTEPRGGGSEAGHRPEGGRIRRGPGDVLWPRNPAENLRIFRQGPGQHPHKGHRRGGRHAGKPGHRTKGLRRSGGSQGTVWPL